MIVLRHCESLFNKHFTLTRRDPGIPDPPLTEHGMAHAEALVAELDGHEITRIIVSPFTRTLQTVRPLAAARRLTPEITPLVREWGAYSCDIGSPATQLAADWPMLDFSGLEESWWTSGRETGEAVEARAREFRNEMRGRMDWETTLLVSHWGFLMAFTQESFENGTWRRFDPN